MQHLKPSSRRSPTTGPLLLLLVALLAILPICQGVGAEIGQTRGEVIAKHGFPKRDDGQGIIFYEWESWTLGIKFVDGVACRLAYGKPNALSENEILGILTANGGKDSWTKSGERLWARSDGATAALDDASGRVLVLQGNSRLVPSSTPAMTPVLASPTPMWAPQARITPRPFCNTPSPATRQTESNAGPIGTVVGFIVVVGMAVGFVMLLQVKPRHFRTSAWPILSPSEPEERWMPPVTQQPAKVPERWIPPTPEPAETIVPPQATIDSITWDQFELVIAEIYRREGYQVEVSSGLGSDGGVDVKLRKDGAITLVQCKQWKVYKVSVKNIREFYGTMVHEGAQHGIFVSTAKYTRDCHEFASGKPVDLLTRADIERLAMAAQRPGENIWDVGQWITGFEATALINNPACPYCHKVMVLRQPPRNKPFWGCPSYPRCRGKREARHELLKAKSW